MKCLVLAAGYATRLYPLTKNYPKPLLEVKGKSILDWLLEDVDANTDVDEHIVVTNHHYAGAFEAWREKCGLKRPVRIVDDGSDKNENRLGAVRDILYAVDKLQVDDDLLVLAGDNVLDFSLEGFVEYYKQKATTCVMRHFEPEKEKLQRTGVVTVDGGGRILCMEEKPQEPRSHWAVPPFYIYRREDIRLIREGIAAGCDTDAPGGLIAWLCRQCAVHAYEMPGKRYDIGNMDSYRKVQEVYQGIVQ